MRRPSATHQLSYPKRVSKQLVFVGILTGIAIGSLGSLVYVIGWGSGMTEVRSSDSNTAHQKPTSTPNQKGQNELAPDLQKLSVADSVLEIVAEFDRLSNEQIAELVQQATHLEPHSISTSIQTLLLGELSRRDPEQALEQVWNFSRIQWNELIAVVFSEWALHDVEESFVVSMELRAPLRETAVRSLLNTQTQISNDRWLTLADKQDYHESMITLLREREALALLDTPLDAFQQVIQDDVDDQQQSDLIQKIARVMIQQNGYESFDILFEYSAWGFRDLLIEEVETQPAAVFAAVRSLTPETRDRFIYPLMDSWIPMDPNAAYEAFSSLEEFNEGLYYLHIFRVWAEVDPEGLLSRVESFPRIERESAARSGILELAETSPEEAAKRTIDYESVIGVSVLNLQESLIRQWAASDPNAAMNWIAENTSEDTWDQAWLFWNGLRHFAKSDPEAALDLALSQPPESVYVERGFAEQVVSDVVDAGELELAMAALDRVPESARLYSFTTVGRALALDHRWQEAIELIDGFSDEDQVQYFDDLTYFAMRDDLVAVLEMVPELASDKVRAQVAQGMLANQEQFGDILTLDQVNYLRRFVDRSEESNGINSN